MAYHAACATGRTETSPLAAESDKFLVMTGIATNSQKTMFKTTTLQVIIELFGNIAWQLLTLRR